MELETNKISTIDCPEDTKIYSCSIISNTEDLHLQWEVYFPDGTFETVTYNSSSGTFHDLGKNVTSTLIAVDVGKGSMESTIELRNFYTMNGTVVNCSIGSLNHKSVTIFVNASGNRNVCSHNYLSANNTLYHSSSSSGCEAVHS